MCTNNPTRTLSYAYKRGDSMIKAKGYWNGSSYIGFIPSLGKYWQFESETAYIEFLRDRGEL